MNNTTYSIKKSEIERKWYIIDAEDKVLGRVGGKILGDQQHNPDHDQGEHRQRHTEYNHGNQHADNGNSAVQQLRHALADHLAQGINIVGIQRHDIAVGVAVKVFDGQRLHMGKHFIAQALQGALGNVSHHTGLGKGGNNADAVKACRAGDGMGQAGKITALLFQQGQDVAIDQGLHEQSALHVGKHADKNADDDRNDLNAVAFHHIAQDAHEDLAGVLDFGARAAGATAAFAFCSAIVIASLFVKVAGAFGLAVINFLIDGVGGQHFGRGTVTADPAVIQHDHMVGVFHAGNTLGNDEHRGAGNLFGKALADLGVGGGIHSGGRVVQNQDAGLFQQSTGNAKALLLAAGNVSAALVNVGVVFIGEALNKFIGAGLLACLLDLGIGGILIAPAQVFGNGSVEQISALADHGDVSVQALGVDFVNVRAVIAYLTAGALPEPQQQLQ